jgi:bifunctional ADP-heptose synthase (sugar kinase/adenylyltransferase)
LDFLKVCEQLGDNLVVGVNSDKFTKSFKEAPIMNETERMYTLSRNGYYPILNTSAGKSLIEEVKPNILAVGSDWARKDYLKQIDVTQDWLDKRHIILCYIPYIQALPISSTEIKRRVREQS